MDDNIREFDKYKRKRIHRKKSTLKRNIKSPISKRRKQFPVVTVVFAVIMIIGIIYAFISEESSDDETAVIPFSQIGEISGKCVLYDSADDPEDREDIYVLYAGLSDADKCVYDMFLDLAMKNQGEAYKSGVIVSENKLSEIGDDYFWNIYYAMCYDHPEFFYLLTEETGIEAYTVTDNGYVSYVYYMDDSMKELDHMVKTFEKAADEFLNDVEMEATDEEIELAIHDKLIDIVTYDYDILDEEAMENRVWDLGNTAYGALVADSEGRKNHAVCSGYAFAFEYLMQQAKIPCAYVTGSANTIPATEKDQDSHAWNVVKIDDRWYEVDATWDDYESDGEDDFFENIKENEDKFFNACHHYYNRTTKEMEYLPATDDTVFEIEGYEPYNPMYDSKHIRSVDEEDIFINSLVPIAE